MPGLFPLFAQTAIALTPADLRWELAQVAVGVLLFFGGSAAVAVFLLRRKTRDRTLVYFGLFSALYAVRLLAALRTTQVLFGYSQAFGDYLIWFITCTISIPFGLFLFHLVGPRLRSLLRWLLTFQAIFAAFGILAASFGAKLSNLHLTNNLVVLGTLVAIALFLLAARPEPGPRKKFTPAIRISLWGFLIWLLFVLHANFLGLHILRGRNVEYVGFAVFVGCLGYVAAQRTFAKEERLLAINKELEIAQQIQSSILPRDVPRIAGIEIAARYVPMSAVAGDFYDFLLLDESRMGVLIADVTGHGVPAALIASMLKVAFAGQSAHADAPADVLTGLNRALCGKFEEHFVTAAYVFIDWQTATLRYAGAGHPPLLFASGSNGNVREIEENGVMLGLFPDATYSAAEIRISPGDRCLLYTDGVVEASNASREEFGKPRLRNFLECHKHLPAGRLTDDLLAEVSRWSNHTQDRLQHVQDDDITLLVLDFRTPP